MTVDYHRGSPPPRPKRREPKPCFFWFVLGAMLGAFAVGLAWNAETTPSAREEPVALALEDQPDTAEQHYDFYRILPETEVPVARDEVIKPTPLPPRLTAPRDEAPRTPSAMPAASGAYLLQIASFKRPEEAQRLIRRLAGLGIQAQIQTVTIDNQDTYHRVRTGPFATRPEVDQLRDRLAQIGLDSLMIKLKQARP